MVFALSCQTVLHVLSRGTFAIKLLPQNSTSHYVILTQNTFIKLKQNTWARQKTPPLSDISVLRTIIKKRIKRDRQTHTRTDIWSCFWTTSAQIPFAFRKISGSEAKLLWYLHRPGSGTGPNAYIPMVSGSTGFQTFRIISTPLGRTPKVVLGCSQAQKTSGAQKINLETEKSHCGIAVSKNDESHLIWPLSNDHRMKLHTFTAATLTIFAIAESHLIMRSTLI